MNLPHTARSALPLLLVVSLSLISGCKDEQPNTAPTIYPVMVTVVSSQAIDSSRRFTASIAARDETALAFRASGKVNKRLVEVGQRVSAGQTLAVMDAQDYQLAVSSVQDQLQAAQVDAKQQRADAERLARLAKDGSVGHADVERQKSRADAAQALQEQVSRQLALAQNRVQYTTLTAPFSGVITAVSVESGQVIAEGQPVFRLARTDALDVVADIPEQLVNDLNRLSAQASLWSQPDQRHAVQLRELSPIANPQTRTFTARFSGAPSAWKLGMTAQLFLQNHTQAYSPSVARLPATALIQRKNQQPFVWKVVGSKIVAQPVTLLQYQQEAVLLAGLQAGDQVVSVGAQKLDAAMAVRPIVRANANLPEVGMSQQGQQP